MELRPLNGHTAVHSLSWGKANGGLGEGRVTPMLPYCYCLLIICQIVTILLK